MNKKKQNQRRVWAPPDSRISCKTFCWCKMAFFAIVRYFRLSVHSSSFDLIKKYFMNFFLEKSWFLHAKFFYLFNVLETQKISYDDSLALCLGHHLRYPCQAATRDLFSLSSTSMKKLKFFWFFQVFFKMCTFWKMAKIFQIFLTHGQIICFCWKLAGRYIYIVS